MGGYACMLCERNRQRLGHCVRVCVQVNERKREKERVGVCVCVSYVKGRDRGTEWVCV